MSSVTPTAGGPPTRAAGAVVGGHRAARRGAGPPPARRNAAATLRSGHAAVRPIGARGARRPAAGRGPGRADDQRGVALPGSRRAPGRAGATAGRRRGHPAAAAAPVRRGGPPAGRRPSVPGAGGAGPAPARLEPGEQPAHRRAGQHDGVLHPPRGRAAGPPGLAAPGPAGRPVGGAVEAGRRAGPVALRRFPADLLVQAPGFGELTVGRGGERLRLVGAPGELALFLSGRQRVSRVQIDGPATPADRLRRASLGF